MPCQNSTLDALSIAFHQGCTLAIQALKLPSSIKTLAELIRDGKAERSVLKQGTMHALCPRLSSSTHKGLGASRSSGEDDSPNTVAATASSILRKMKKAAAFSYEVSSGGSPR